MNKISKLVIKFPGLTILLTILITAFFGYHLKDLKINNDIEAMIPDDHPSKIDQRAIEKDFGKAEMVVVGLMTDTIFKTGFLTKVKELSSTLKHARIESDPFIDPETGKKTTKQIKCIKDVVSLSTIPYIEGDEAGMRVEKLMEDVPQTPEEMAQLRKRIFSWDMYVGTVISRDEKATLIGIQQKEGLSYDEISRMVTMIRETIDKMNFGPGVNIRIAGEPFVAAMISHSILNDLNTMLPGVFIVVVVFLYISMRRISSVFLIFITIGISVTCCMGLLPILGFKATLISSSIPVLLVAVGSAYAIHMVSHYNSERAAGKEPAQAVQDTFDTIGVAVLGAAATTVAGFLSFMTTHIIPIREFGLLTAIGTAMAFFTSLAFVPAVMLFIDRFKKKSSVKGKTAESPGLDLVPVLTSLADFLTRHSKAVFATSTIIFVVAFALTFRVHPDMNPIKNFKKSSEIRKAEDLLNKEFNGMTTLVISIESTEENYFQRPDALKKLDEFKTYLEEKPAIGMVSSIALSLKRMNYAMNSNNPAFDKIPDTKEQVAQYLLLYNNPEDLEKMVTPDFKKARILVLLKEGSVKTLSKINDESKAWLTNAFPGLKVSMGGTVQLALTANNLIVIGQMWNIVTSIVAVFIISALIFRSLVGGLLTIVPLSICIILNFGILGILGFPLDVGTAMVSSIGIGTGIDYSIHFLNGVRYGYLMPEPTSPVHTAIKINGNPIIFNAVSVAFGFAVLMLSTFVPLIKLGALVAFTMITSSVLTLLILPVIINVFEPKFLKRF